MITFPTVLAGFIASIVTEIFKISPSLTNSKLKTSIVVLIVDLVVSFGYAFLYADVAFTFETFISVALFSLLTYKTITKPVGQAMAK